MITLIDNEDSFVYTLARYVELCGFEYEVIRYNVFTKLPAKTKALIISPGPKAPKDMSETNNIISKYAPKLPILGVCLGHQCIGHVFGARIFKSSPMHGKTSLVHFTPEETLFSDIPNPADFARYHSLSVTDIENTDLIRIAWDDYGLIMGLKHKQYPCYGIQFHPESVLSVHGKTLIQNFLNKAL